SSCRLLPFGSWVQSSSPAPGVSLRCERAGGSGLATGTACVAAPSAGARDRDSVVKKVAGAVLPANMPEDGGDVQSRLGYPVAAPYWRAGMSLRCTGSTPNPNPSSV